MIGSALHDRRAFIDLTYAPAEVRHLVPDRGVGWLVRSRRTQPTEFSTFRARMSSDNANEFSRESYLRNVRMRGADLEDQTAHEFVLGASGSLWCLVVGYVGQQKSRCPNGCGLVVILVAGVGFEPTTFRL